MGKKLIQSIKCDFSLSLLDRERNLSVSVDFIKGMKLNFEAIAVCGVSGMVFGSLISYALDKPLWVIRKKNERTHSSNNLECGYFKDIESYLIIDDLIESGKTVRHIITRVRDHASENRFKPPLLTGAYLYYEKRFVPPSMIYY